MAITKTWLTTSRNPRDSHGRIAGDTTGISQEFGNGLMYPGDGNQGPEEVANCRCVMTIGGKARGRTPASPANPTTIGTDTSRLTQAHVDDIEKSLAEWHKTIGDDLGVESRWSGTVRVGNEVSDEIVKSNSAAVKEWSCQISISERYARWSEIERQRIMAHEMAHSYSQGLDFYTFQTWAPFDEAVAEAYARHLVLQRFGLPAYGPGGQFNRVSNCYQRWVGQMELWRLRSATYGTNAAGKEFYKQLLKTPLEKRAKWIADECKVDIKKVRQLLHVREN